MMNHDYRFETACQQHYRGQYDASIETLKGILAEHPQHAESHAMLAANLLAMHRLHAAEHEIGLALQLAPQSPGMHLLKARLHLVRQQPGQAIACAEEALRLQPDDIDALLLLHDAQWQQDRRQEALASLQAAATLAPDDLRVSVAFGEYFLHSGDPRQAYEHARQALASSAEDEAANLLMGRTLLALGQLQEAHYHARLVISLNPSSEAALRLLGNLKFRRNPLVGLWWRANARLSSMTLIKGALSLISAFLLFTLLAQVLLDLGYPLASSILSYAWLAVVVYSWFGLPLYRKALQKELEQFRFNKDF